MQTTNVSRSAILAASLSGCGDFYTEKWIQDKLLERYGEHIVFADVSGRKNVICWKKWLRTL